MNFLLHRHLTHCRSDSPVAGVGAMLPDLWRLVDRRVRPAPAGVAWNALGDAGREVRDVMRGIEDHLDEDRWFHEAAVFREGERATIDALRGAGTTAKKLTLFAHPLWEMCLDGALVRRQGEAAVREALAEGFHLSAGAARAAVRAHHFAHAAEGELDAGDFDARMDHVAEELSKGPWIGGYARPDGLVRALGGMRRRFGLAPLSEEERAKIEGAIASLEARADAALEQILALRSARGGDA